MSVSTYKRWMKESYLYEADEFKARSTESGKIVYYKTKRNIRRSYYFYGTSSFKSLCYFI